MFFTRPITKYLVTTAITAGLLFSTTVGAGTAQAKNLSTQEGTATPSASSTSNESPRFRLRISLVGHPDGLSRIAGKPGATIRVPLQLENRSEEATEAQTFAANPVTMVNGGFAVDLSDSPKVGATQWVNLSEKPFKFPGNSSRNTAAVVKIPQDAKPGQYVVGLGIQNANPTKNSKGGISLGQTSRQVVAVAITLPGPKNPSVEFGDASYLNSGKFFSANLDVSNTGNQILRSEFTVTLKDSNHNEIKSFTHKMPGFYVDTATKLELRLDEPLANGDYFVDATMTGGGLNEPAVAKDVPLQVGDEENELASPPTPKWVYVVIGLVVLVLIVLVIWWLRRRRAQVIKARASVPQTIMTADVLAFLGDRALGFQGDPVGRLTVALSPAEVDGGLDVVTGEGQPAKPSDALVAIDQFEELKSTSARSALITQETLNQVTAAGTSYNGPETLIAVADPHAELKAIQQQFLYRK